jgi:hypothetical protein
VLIESDKLRVRSGGDYIAIYGTQDEAQSNCYDLLSKDEALKLAHEMDVIAERVKEVAELLRYASAKQPIPSPTN